jgi:hypothetical protein
MDRQSFYHQLLNEAVLKVNPTSWIVHYDSGNSSIPAHKFYIVEDARSWIKHKLVTVVFVNTLLSISHRVGPVEDAKNIWLYNPDSLDELIKFLEKVKQFEYDSVGINDKSL